ncbi:putative membrane protein [Mycobacterium xenopi 4042]|uniref:Putative membrane protein n=1 Tax=Mycobacterium xenopi 4042 TaxID=1299334 RepID=X8AP02_MYCXE|nr:putative membrane protein [Mycobacterium xenopi 4042]
MEFEFPYVIYQGLTMYLLLAIGWHGGEELATIHASSIGNIVGFIVLVSS